MKSEIKDVTTKIGKYPCLMQNNNNPNLIVLFTKPCTGMCVASDTAESQVGVYETWAPPEHWSIFVGEVVLSN